MTYTNALNWFLTTEQSFSGAKTTGHPLAKTKPNQTTTTCDLILHLIQELQIIDCRLKCILDLNVKCITKAKNIGEKKSLGSKLGRVL